MLGPRDLDSRLPDALIRLAPIEVFVAAVLLGFSLFAVLYTWLVTRHVRKRMANVESRMLATEAKVSRWTRYSTTHDMPAVKAPKSEG
jgi:hypothetical protein